MKVLMIDDSEVMQEYYSILLKSWVEAGNEVVFASNGAMALGALACMADPPDFIFLDLEMPIMDGIAFLKYRQTHESLTAIPVFVLTESAGGRVKEARELWADEVLSKPLNILSFRAVLKRFGRHPE